MVSPSVGLKSETNEGVWRDENRKKGRLEGKEGKVSVRTDRRCNGAVRKCEIRERNRKNSVG